MKLQPIIEAESTQLARRIADTLKRDCQPFLNAIDGQVSQYPLLRGVSKLPAHYRVLTKHRVRLQNRTPRDSSAYMHDLANEIFTKRFGEPFRNSLFVGGYEVAERYANEALVAIFPIGQFRFVWSPKIDDFFSYFEDSPYDAYSNYAHQTGISKHIADTEELFDVVKDKDVLEYFIPLYYIDHSLKDAISSGSEIMLRCPTYYALVLNVEADQDYNVSFGYKKGPQTHRNILSDIQQALR